MAIPVLRAQFFSRSDGHSAVNAAAYRSGEKIYDEREGVTHDYSRKQGVVHTEIMTPGNAPEWLKDRKELWNAVEAVEDSHSRRATAQLAQEVVVALPRELSHDENIALVQDYVQNQFVSKGMVADVAIHEEKAGDGGRNPHAHVLLTLRDVNENGFGKKNREWNDGRKGQRKVTLDNMRDNWEGHINKHLEQAGSNERISMKSYEEQGIDRKSQQHMGKHAWHMEQREGKATYLGKHNRNIQQENHEKDYLDAARSRKEAQQQGKVIDIERHKKLERQQVIKQEEAERNRERGIERG